jgi:hypothetical protein
MSLTMVSGSLKPAALWMYVPVCVCVCVCVSLSLSLSLSQVSGEALTGPLSMKPKPTGITVSATWVPEILLLN